MYRPPRRLRGRPDHDGRRGKDCTTVRTTVRCRPRSWPAPPALALSVTPAPVREVKSPWVTSSCAS
jgi:hypothetical protein